MVSSASLGVEGYACLAIRRRLPGTTQQALLSQVADGLHGWRRNGSWTYTALAGVIGHTYAWWGSSAISKEACLRV
jgi:hypothetical protein